MATSSHTQDTVQEYVEAVPLSPVTDPWHFGTDLDPRIRTYD